MAPATTFHFDAATMHARAASRLEFAAAFAIVIALHAALALWILRSRERPVPPPEPPRTIVARLLRVAPAVVPTPAPPAPSVMPPRAAAEPPALARPRPTPTARVKPTVTPRPVHRETPPLATEAPSPAPTPAPPEAAIPAAPPAIAPTTPATSTAAHSAPAQPAAANAPPKDVTHVDCSIAEPDYPEISRRRNETGTAVVRFVVGVDGHVDSAKIERSSGYARLDTAALDAVRGGTCRPWKEAGVAVRVAYAQPFVFGLGN